MVTNLEQLKQMANKEIEIPGWSVEDKISVKVKRVSLMGLAAKGKIPNQLLAAAQQVFTQTVKSETSLKDIGEVMELVAEETLVEPTVKDLDEIGLELTDEQKIILFNYSQTGVVELERFRKEQSNTSSNQHGPGVQQKA